MAHINFNILLFKDLFAVFFAYKIQKKLIFAMQSFANKKRHTKLCFVRHAKALCEAVSLYKKTLYPIKDLKVNSKRV